ncbi:hypothetical protein [Nesterenkonia marinintestina]|uniref:hypothetical protein n=1 Tax=Nesterenkonia marinintestina TaxID=2979865 RepID=UPI0021C03B6B|nr:hypothetical protein [Nesterenkonia sp. GX14115]
MSRRTDLRFDGHIVGAGTASGTRLVLGCWSRTPHGPFADVMVERADGRRTLLAPDEWVAEFVSTTYRFDEVRIVDVVLTRSGTRRGSVWELTAGPLDWRFTIGARAPLGHLFRAIPGPVARALPTARVTDQVARRIMPGVRTVGSAGNGRLEWYAATDLHPLRTSRARWDGADMGGLVDVDPPTRFGFSSTPRTPGVTAVTTTVRIPAHHRLAR